MSCSLPHCKSGRKGGITSGYAAPPQSQTPQTFLAPSAKKNETHHTGRIVALPRKLEHRVLTTSCRSSMLWFLLSIGYLTGDDMILATVKQVLLKEIMRFNVYNSRERNTFMFAKVSELLHSPEVPK